MRTIWTYKILVHILCTTFSYPTVGSNPTKDPPKWRLWLKPGYKQRKALLRVQICESLQGSRCSQALQPKTPVCFFSCQENRAYIYAYIYACIREMTARKQWCCSHQCGRINELWSESCTDDVVRVCHALNTVAWGSILKILLGFNFFSMFNLLSRHEEHSVRGTLTLQEQV